MDPRVKPRGDEKKPVVTKERRSVAAILRLAERPLTPPSPRTRGEGAASIARGEIFMRHIFRSRLALPLRILTLSSSESGTVCIQSSAGGFMTNGQSTANRI